MNKKYIIWLIVIIVLILIFVVFERNKGNSKEVNNKINNENKYLVNETDGNYILYNKNGEEVVTTDDSGALEIYKIDENYKPQIPLKESDIVNPSLF